jgi:YesN/AraC family two-component response regulator
MLRHGMAMLIDAEPDMQVIAEASDSVETLAFLKKNSDVDII